MRFTRLILEGYIGIYHGLHTDKIDIDLHQCTHRILLIRGENGSGKTTIFNAMTVLPDSNDQFIPGMPASKYAEIYDNGTIYQMNFIHPVRADGTREPTKAYIKRCFPGQQPVELNPNGNVTSYKDILYEELALDANFISLSQLSNENKGIAGMKPAERKRYVNSIMTSLEFYNNIYKVLGKQTTQLKSLIQSISVKLGALGDRAVLESNLARIDEQIAKLESYKDIANARRMKAQATKELIDPTGAIQSRYNEYNDAKNRALAEMQKLYRGLSINVLNPPAEYGDQLAKLGEYRVNLDQLKKDSTRANEDLNKAREEKRDLQIQIDQKTRTINTLTDSESFETICDMLALAEANVKRIEEEIKVTGINPGTFTKDEYITALEAVKEIKEAIATFKGSFDEGTIERVLSDYKAGVAQIIDVSEFNEKISKYYQRSPFLNEKIAQCDDQIERLQMLQYRPTGCTTDECYFIKDLVVLYNQDIPGQRAAYARELNELEVVYQDASRRYEEAMTYNECLMMFKNIIRMVRVNGSVLVKLPHGKIYESEMTFIENLMNNFDFGYIDEIYKYIHLANLFDEYLVELDAWNSLEERHRLYASKSEAVEQLGAEIDALEEKLSTYTGIIESAHSRAEKLFHDVDDMNVAISEQEKLVATLAKLAQCYDIVTTADNSMKQIVNQMATIQACNTEIDTKTSEINQYIRDMRPLTMDRDKIVHSIKLATEYEDELTRLNAQYELIDKVRYYSSPTTGIQLVFMEMYMGKIIELANSLLSMLFNGRYVIQPFVINESEFRIPCLGDDIVNDDISSMSSAQVAMISMIIGFSLLHNSSTKYNIIKMDELDASLDEVNRAGIVQLLYDIMDIMHTEQCIMISHNSEIDTANTDVIVLKHENLSEDFMNGNVIWKY